MSLDFVRNTIFDLMCDLHINYMPSYQQLEDNLDPMVMAVVNMYGVDYLRETMRLMTSSEYRGAVIRGEKKIIECKDLRARKQLRTLINEFGVLKLRNMVYQEDARMCIAKMGIYDKEVI